MDVNWLKDFIALAQQRNFSRAADARHLSQPAFSRRIRTLEAAVGVGLVNRETLPLTLTPAGEVFLAEAAQMLERWDAALERCRAIADADRGKVRFATSHALYLTHYAQHIVPKIDPSEVETDLSAAYWNASQFVTALQQSYCDMILCYWHEAMEIYAPLAGVEFEHLRLARDYLVPLSAPGPCGPRHALGRQNTGKAPHYCLDYAPGSGLGAVVSHLRRHHAANLLSLSQSGMAAGIKDMVVAGYGLGWLPESLCRTEMQEGRLVPAGDGPRDEAPLEIRLYRRAANDKPSVEALWGRLCAKQA